MSWTAKRQPTKPDITRAPSAASGSHGTPPSLNLGTGRKPSPEFGDREPLLLARLRRDRAAILAREGFGNLESRPPPDAHGPKRRSGGRLNEWSSHCVLTVPLATHTEIESGLSLSAGDDRDRQAWGGSMEAVIIGLATAALLAGLDRGLAVGPRAQFGRVGARGAASAAGRPTSCGRPRRDRSADWSARSTRPPRRCNREPLAWSKIVNS